MMDKSDLDNVASYSISWPYSGDWRDWCYGRERSGGGSLPPPASPCQSPLSVPLMSSDFIHS